MKLLSDHISTMQNVMQMSRMMLKVSNQVGDFLTFTFYTIYSEVIIENKIETKAPIHMQYHNYNMDEIPNVDEI